MVFLYLPKTSANLLSTFSGRRNSWKYSSFSVSKNSESVLSFLAQCRQNVHSFLLEMFPLWTVFSCPLWEQCVCKWFEAIFFGLIVHESWLLEMLLLSVDGSGWKSLLGVAVFEHVQERFLVDSSRSGISVNIYKERKNYKGIKEWNIAGNTKYLSESTKLNYYFVKCLMVSNSLIPTKENERFHKHRVYLKCLLAFSNYFRVQWKPQPEFSNSTSFSTVYTASIIIQFYIFL